MKHKWIWLILIILMVIVVLRFAIQKPKAQTHSGGSGRMMQAVPVELAPVKTLDITERSVFSGNIEAKSSYKVAPKISGQLQKLHVNIGTRVRKGDLIAELDDRILQQEYQKAQANVEMARATAHQTEVSLDYARTELDRKRELFERNFLSQSEFDIASNQFANAQAQDNIAKASLNSALAVSNSAELQLSFTKIMAEWSDDAQYRIIGERYAEEGDQLGAGNPIVSLMDIERIIAVVEVVEQDYARIKIGQEAQISIDSYPNRKFVGKVLRIAPMLQEASRQARVEIEVPNPNAVLKPGMFARVNINFQTKKAVAAVEERAICKFQGKEGVFLVNPEDETVSFVEVQKGITGEGYVEIISPEISGDVVTLGQDMLDPGRKITIAGTEQVRGAK